MSPIIEQKKKRFNYLWILYICIFIICVWGIGVAVYNQFYKDEELPFIPSPSQEDTEEEDKYNELKAAFPTIFTNNIKKLQQNIEAQKISEKLDFVVTAFSYNKNDENVKLNASIPLINIKKQIPIDINNEISKKYRIKAEEIENTKATQNVIYNISYVAYLQNDILSLIIRSELKEGNKNQKIEIQTYNYNIKEDKEVYLEDFLELKGIKIEEANTKIRNEIKKIQEQNDMLKQVLVNQGEIYQRDYNSDKYNVENAKNYFLGEDGMLYVVYAYGNTDDTAEMDIVIFR